MFEQFRARLYLAAVQAELKGQHDDQSFVNIVCQLPENIEHLRLAREQVHFRQRKIGPFLAVCLILGESLDSKNLSMEIKTICAMLLAQRLQKVSSNQQFRLRYLHFFGRLEERFSMWTEKHT